MGIRNGYTVIFQRIPNQKQDIRGVFVFTIINSINPEFDRKLNATFPKAAQFAIGRIGLLQHFGMFRHRRLYNIGDQVNIRIIFNTLWSFVAVCAALIRIIDDTGGNEIFVWNNDPSAVISF